MLYTIPVARSMERSISGAEVAACGVRGDWSQSYVTLTQGACSARVCIASADTCHLWGCNLGAVLAANRDLLSWTIP